MPKGEHCVVKYSNPNIFVECWMQEMQKAYEDAKRLVFFFFCYSSHLVASFFFFEKRFILIFFLD